MTIFWRMFFGDGFEGWFLVTVVGDGVLVTVSWYPVLGSRFLVAGSWWTFFGSRWLMARFFRLLLGIVFSDGFWRPLCRYLFLVTGVLVL